MKRCQTVYVGVVDVSSLAEQRCHLLPVSGGAGSHKHGSLGEPDFSPSRPRTSRSIPGFRSRPVRLWAKPSLQLILPTLFGSFGPGMVSGRHLPWSVPRFSSLCGERRSGWFGMELSAGCAPWWRNTGNGGKNFKYELVAVMCCLQVLLVKL